MSEAVAPKERGRGLPAIPIGLFAEVGLLLAVGLIFVQRSPDLPVIRQAMTLSEVAFLLTAGVWMGLVAVTRPRVRIYSAGMVAPFLLYLLAALVSLFFSPYTMNDLEGIRELVGRLYLMAFLLALASYAATAVTYRRLLLAWSVAALMVVGLLALSLIGGPAVGLSDFEGRFIGLFRNPNALGGALAGTVLCFLPIALLRGPAPSLGTFRFITRLAVPGLLLGAILSDSQGAILAIMVGVAAWPLVRVQRHWGPVLPILMMVIAMFLIVAVTQFEAVSRTLEQVLGMLGYEAGGRKFGARIDMIESRFRAIMQHPFTGVGLAKAILSHDPMSPIAAHGSHFTILGIILETGVLGLAAVGTIFVTFLGIMRRNARLPLQGYPEWRALNEGLTIAFIGFLVFGLTHDVQTNRTMWLLASVTVCFAPAFSEVAELVSPLPYRPSRFVWVFSRRSAGYR